MTIAKANILTRVNQICKRSESDIDDILLDALTEISHRTGVLTKEATGTTTANQEYVSAPSDLAGNMIHSFYTLSAGETNTTEPPLKAISWEQYKNGWDGWVLYNDRIYFRPTPTLSTDVYHVEYSYLDDDVDNIELPDRFKGALERLVAAYLYEKYERWDGMDAQMTIFERKLALLSGSRPTPPVATYNGQEM